MATSITCALNRVKKDLDSYLTPEHILYACRATGYQWRERLLGPVLTVQALGGCPTLPGWGTDGTSSKLDTCQVACAATTNRGMSTSPRFAATGVSNSSAIPSSETHS